MEVCVHGIKTITLDMEKQQIEGFEPHDVIKIYLESNSGHIETLTIFGKSGTSISILKEDKRNDFK